MTQTLRRELKLKITEVLHGHVFAHEIPLTENEQLVEELADAVLQLRGFSKPLVNLKNADPAWSILAGAEFDNTANILAKEATDTFEQQFGFGNLPWNKDSMWEKFYKFVIRVYTQDKNVWRDYVVWRNDKGKYTAYSNRKIRENPQAFMDTGYPEFEASKMYSKPKQGRKFERLNSDG